MSKTTARMYAESHHEQQFEALVDELHKLMDTSPDFILTLTRMTQMDNASAARVVVRMPKFQQRELLKWLLPFARIGLSAATFAMEDKYTSPDESDG